MATTIARLGATITTSLRWRRACRRLWTLRAWPPSPEQQLVESVRLGSEQMTQRLLELLHAHHGGAPEAYSMHRFGIRGARAAVHRREEARIHHARQQWHQVFQVAQKEAFEVH